MSGPRRGGPRVRGGPRLRGGHQSSGGEPAAAAIHLPGAGRRRQIAVSLAVLFAAALAAATASDGHLWPRGTPPGVVLLLVIAAAATVLGLHRPLGGLSLGLGCAALPPLLIEWGVSAAAVAGGAALALAELLRRLLERRMPYGPPERRRRLRVLVAAARFALAIALAAALVERLGLAGRPALAAAAGACSAIVLALEAAEQRLRGRPPFAPAGSFWSPVVYDLVGWATGLVIVDVAERGGSANLVGWLLLMLCVPAIEAARAALTTQALEQRSAHLQSLGGAGERMAASGNEIGRLAERVRAEVRRVLPFSWFHFERLGDADDHRHWRSGPDGLLEQGRPNPGPHPPPLPGVHRRSSWRLLDRELRTQIDARALARLRLWCDPRRLTPEAMELFELLLPQLAASVERTVLNREARLDPLTGLAHRRVLEAELEVACARLRAAPDGGHEPFALVLCDLDHFKAINDSWGHPTGDEALRHTARILGRIGRESDLCSRFGGEEFALLLRATDGKRALAVAERLRREVATSAIETSSGQLRVTLSAGVAAAGVAGQGAGSTPAQVVAAADAALYAAKRSGRNRCLLFAGDHMEAIDGDSVAPPAAPDPPAGQERA